MAEEQDWVSTHAINADGLNDQQNPFMEISTSPRDTPPAQQAAQAEFGLDGFISDDTIQGRLAKEVYGRGKEKAKGFVNLYANIDPVRPYFDVEPVEVANRLLFSLLPFRKKNQEADNLDFEPEESKKADLYGPLMLCFTLSSILLLGLKFKGDSANDSNMEEGTLLGSSLFICFSFWLVSSVIYYFVSFIFNGTSGLLEILSLTGYAQFGICISLLVHCFISGKLDLAVMIVFGGLSAITLGVELFKIVPQKKHGVILAALAILVQVSFLVYLKIFSAVELGDFINRL